MGCFLTFFCHLFAFFFATFFALFSLSFCFFCFFSPFFCFCECCRVWFFWFVLFDFFASPSVVTWIGYFVTFLNQPFPVFACLFLGALLFFEPPQFWNCNKTMVCVSPLFSFTFVLFPFCLEFGTVYFCATFSQSFFIPYDSSLFFCHAHFDWDLSTFQSFVSFLR